MIIHKHDVSSDECINLVNAFILDVNNSLLVCQPYIESDQSGVLPSKKHSCHEGIIHAWLKEYADEIQAKKERECQNSENGTDHAETVEAPLDVNVLMP